MKPHSSTFFSWHLPRHVLTACGLLLLASLTPTVHAACTPFVQPVRYVGPLGVGSQCTDATIQDAINNSTCSHGNTIYVSPYGLGGTRTYSNQHLTINNKNVTLIGESGTHGCGSPPLYCLGLISDPVNCVNPSSPVITLDGNNTNGSVIQITGNSNVSLKFLEVKRGNKNGSGGGISFLGNGSLSLLTSSVVSNQATYGGGIDVTTSGGDLALNLYDNVTISGNTASESGGGVRVQAYSNAATLAAVSPRLYVFNNEATNKYGGGVQILGRVDANIGSATPVFGTISGNRAAYGGGIAVLAGPDNTSQDPVLNLFSTDANVPIGMLNNSATHTGGGIFAKSSKPTVTTYTQATVNLWDFQLDGNTAQNGAAIYGDVSDALVNPFSLVHVNLNTGTRPAGSLMCTESARCNSISGNRTEDTIGTRTAGSVVLMQSGWSSFYAHRFRMQNNVADYAIHTLDGYRFSISNCLIANNDLAASATLRMEDASLDSHAKVNWCTFANNVIGGNQPNTFFIEANGNGYSDGHDILDLGGNIFSQPSWHSDSVRVTGGTVNATYNLSREISTLGGGIGNFAGMPTFLDSAAGNYRLMPGSLGVDYAPGQGGFDLAGNPRDVDLAGVSSVYSYGPRDLGAYEIGCQINYIAGPICNLDVDGDNVLNTTDAQMMLRRLFGFNLVGLRVGLPRAGSCAQRTSVADLDTFVTRQLSPHIALSSRAAWDIDGDGTVNALTDGLLVLRAVLGLTGTSVTNKAIGNNNPARSDWTSVRSYLNGTCGMTLP